MWSALTTFGEALLLPLTYLIDPDKRLHVGYLLSAALLAFWVFRRTGTRGTFLKFLFHPKVWWSASAKLDYKMLVFNGFVKVFLLGQFVIFGLQIAFAVTDALTIELGPVSQSVSPGWGLLIYALAITVVGDFSVYLLHYLMHRVPFLWAFHKIHHSATTLNPVTQFRIHPVELILNNLRAMVIFGLLAGLTDYFTNHALQPLALMGVNMFGLAFLAWGSNLRHSHVRLSYFKPIEYLLISPFQHQIHHSKKREHHNKNLGSKLAIWDWMFGTLMTSSNVKRLQFGLEDESDTHDTLLDSLTAPFIVKSRSTAFAKAAASKVTHVQTPHQSERKAQPIHRSLGTARHH